MTELTVELPVKLNGAIITRDVFIVLDELQTGGTLTWDKSEYNNEGIKDLNEYAAEINNYLIEIIACANINEDVSKETNLLANIHWLRDRLNSLSLPDDLMKQLNK